MGSEHLLLRRLQLDRNCDQNIFYCGDYSEIGCEGRTSFIAEIIVR